MSSAVLRALARRVPALDQRCPRPGRPACGTCPDPSARRPTCTRSPPRTACVSTSTSPSCSRSANDPGADRPGGNPRLSGQHVILCTVAAPGEIKWVGCRRGLSGRSLAMGSQALLGEDVQDLLAVPGQLGSPTPFTSGKLASVDGGAAAICRRVASWKITYAGMPCSFATAARQARSRSNTASASGDSSAQDRRPTPGGPRRQRRPSAPPAPRRGRRRGRGASRRNRPAAPRAAPPLRSVSASVPCRP